MLVEPTTKPAAAPPTAASQPSPTAAPTPTPIPGKPALEVLNLPASAAPDATGNYNVECFLRNKGDTDLTVTLKWSGPGNRTLPEKSEQFLLRKSEYKPIVANLGPAATVPEKGFLQAFAGDVLLAANPLELQPPKPSPSLPSPLPTTMKIDAQGQYKLTFLLRNDTTAASAAYLSGRWHGIKATMREASLTPSKVERGTMASVTLHLGDPLPASEPGFLRIYFCNREKPGSEDLLNPAICTVSDSALELPGSVALSGSARPLWIPLAAAFLSLAAGFAFVWAKFSFADSVELEWKIDDSFAANINIGLLIVGTLATIGLSFDAESAKYSKAAFVAWTQIYALSSAVAPGVFGLLKTKSSGTLAGFAAANLFNVFGVFGQLYIAGEVLQMLPASNLIAPSAASVLEVVPYFLAVCLVWYVIQSLRAIPELPVGKAQKACNLL